MRPHQILWTFIFLIAFITVSCSQPTEISVSVTDQPVSTPASDETQAPVAEANQSVTRSEAGDHSLTLVWQSEFSPDGALISPSDMVVDDLGNVYVSSQSEKNIKKFDSNGKLIAQWGGRGGGAGQFNLASGIALDKDNNVYVVDFFNARIQKFDNVGNFLLEWNTRTAPASLGIDMQGHVYLDIFFRSDYHIQKFDTNGTLLHEWGAPGTDDGQFSAMGDAGPEDVAIDKDGYIYVADRFNHRVQKFDSAGNFITKFGGEASTEGHGLFEDPRGVAVDSEGNIYVLDSYFLQKLDAQGNFIAQWSTLAKGDLYRAAIVGLDTQNNLYTFALGDVTSVDGTPTMALVLKKFSQR